MEKEKIGRFISALRREKGMTQKDLAEQLYVSDRTVSKWERGAGLPDALLMIQLSDILGISVNELLSGERMEDKAYTSQEKEDIQKATSVIYSYLHAQEKKLRGKITVTVIAIVLIFYFINLFVEEKGKDRILFPPDILCEQLQREAEIEAALIVDRRDSGVYDYVCSYEMDKYGNVHLLDDRVWQSYTDAVPLEVYDQMKELCPGRIASVDVLDTGYLVCSYTDSDPAAAVFTELDQMLKVCFSYEVSAKEGISAALVSDDALHILSFHDEEERSYVAEIDKSNGEKNESSFSFSELDPTCSENDSTGGFLFDRKNIWVKDNVFYFVETYHKGIPAAVFAAYDLKNGEVLSFEKRENANVVMVRKEPGQSEVAVLINPMGYQPLELYVLDDKTLEVKSVVKLELPNEYMTRLHTGFEREIYYFFDGDLTEDRIAVWFPDIVSRDDLDDAMASRILVVYDRSSGEAVWRGRFKMKAEYEFDSVRLKAAR